ncbi:FtsX-like permease family protein, partial [uncultured Amnibacterium sp.]|uniref:FtsX-like permease family protein n=1 Tax=uncultured Amnibacterium sp. TaxID=1631851 RepID=UPI0035CC6708
MLVAALSSAFGVALLQGTALLDAAAEADPVTGGSDTVGVLLQITSVVFIGIAMYSGAVVTTNTVSVIVAGRVRQIALRRLLGSTARAERGAVAREGLVVGLIGAAVGVVVGSGAVAGIAAAATSLGVLARFDHSYLQPQVLLP